MPHILSTESRTFEEPFCKSPGLSRKKSGILQKVAKNLGSLPFYWPYNWTFGIIFGSSDAEFQVELEGTKKCVHQKCPKDRASNGKTDEY